jgi:hypothetical protein
MTDPTFNMNCAASISSNPLAGLGGQSTTYIFLPSDAGVHTFGIRLCSVANGEAGRPVTVRDSSTGVFSTQLINVWFEVTASNFAGYEMSNASSAGLPPCGSPGARSSLTCQKTCNAVTYVFTSDSDANCSAYSPGELIDPNQMFVALPATISKNQPVLVSTANGSSVLTASVNDKGPWYDTCDEYWQTGTLPKVQTDPVISCGTNKNETSTNKAAIDLTPALFIGLGLGPNTRDYQISKFGLAPVLWRFK